jgi:hypothetical protein
MTQRAIPFLEKFGAEIAPMSMIQEATLRLFADDAINGKFQTKGFSTCSTDLTKHGILGRGVAVTKRGNYDLCDDREAHDGGDIIEKLVKEGAIQ